MLIKVGISLDVWTGPILGGKESNNVKNAEVMAQANADSLKRSLEWQAQKAAEKLAAAQQLAARRERIERERMEAKVREEARRERIEQERFLQALKAKMELDAVTPLPNPIRRSS